MLYLIKVLDPLHVFVYLATFAPPCNTPTFCRLRFMVASRDLRAGDVVLKERVCVHAPNLENSPPVCVVCYRLLSPASFRH